MESIEKIIVLSEATKLHLRTVRDLKASAKSTKKTKLTKIEKHTALLVDLYADLEKAFEKSKG